jgi:pantetheine-phosphate adenylyltransferase
VSREERRRHLAVYPGSFDPLTKGHLDIARRAAQLFDSLIVAVYAVPAKHLLFSLDERVQLWQEVLIAEAVSNICVEPYAELTTDYVRSVGGQVIIKGLRSSSDFEAEFQQGLMNRQLSPEIETVCLLTTLPHLFVSSSLLKEVARWGGDVTNLASRSSHAGTTAEL